MPSNYLRIHDVTIMTDDVDALSDFYHRLGLKPVFRKSGELTVFAAGNCELAIHAGPAHTGALALSLVVKDLAGTAAHLQSIAVAYEGPMALRPGMMGLQLRDPKGNVLELLSPDP